MYTINQERSTSHESGGTPMGARVLVVDDERVVTEVVERYLQREGYEVSLASDGAEALKLAQEWAPDLVVLDLMLPVIDGLEVCRRLRQDSQIPIIMLTARGEETDRVVGLELGADDYIVKPFSPRELVARVKSVLRRTSAGPAQAPGGTLRFGSLTVNPQTRDVTLQGTPVHLTAKEFDLLWFLASHPSQVFTREQLMNQVWDYTYAADPSTVTVHIRRLREKVEADPIKPRYVKTVWGVGYKFEGSAA
ncbi:MAG: response regulator transcription factor [Chloroflexi bacterium]|nr:response regulator transcription factor [Chloroflexota bacterium]MDA1219184.1 response regulator transcription factor [Chloroflexota bacterium]